MHQTFPMHLKCTIMPPSCTKFPNSLGMKAERCYAFGMGCDSLTTKKREQQQQALHQAVNCEPKKEGETKNFHDICNLQYLNPI